MKHIEITLPKFLLAEEPTAGLDRFIYIYSPIYMSLILIIAEESHTALLNEKMRKAPRKTFLYENEVFEFVILQNNVLITGGQLAPEISEIEFLDLAWKWWENYLKWEDNNINEDNASKFN